MRNPKTEYVRISKLAGKALAGEGEKIYKLGYEHALDACVKFLEIYSPEAVALLLKYGRAIIMDGTLPKIPVKKEGTVTEGSGNVFADLGFSDAKKRLTDAKVRSRKHKRESFVDRANRAPSPGSSMLATTRLKSKAAAVKKSKQVADIYKPTCEICGKPPRHAEYWFERERFWCESCTPWSGHYEHCPIPCKKLMRELRKKPA